MRHGAAVHCRSEDDVLTSLSSPLTKIVNVLYACIKTPSLLAGHETAAIRYVAKCLFFLKKKYLTRYKQVRVTVSVRLTQTGRIHLPDLVKFGKPCFFLPAIDGAQSSHRGAPGMFLVHRQKTSRGMHVVTFWIQVVSRMQYESAASHSTEKKEAPPGGVRYYFASVAVVGRRSYLVQLT